VEQAPAQSLRSGLGPGSIETKKLEPAHQVGRHHDGRHPVRVGFLVRKGEGQKPRLLQALNVQLDVGMGPHGLVELDRLAVLVAVVAPVAVLKTREQAVLGAGMQWLGAR
jgi:hypothetical protein